MLVCFLVLTLSWLQDSRLHAGSLCASRESSLVSLLPKNPNPSRGLHSHDLIQISLCPKDLTFIQHHHVPGHAFWKNINLVHNRVIMKIG